MGYTTEFSGEFISDKPFSDKMKKFLALFSETRRLGRNVEEAFGVDGEFFVFGIGEYGQDKDATIKNINTPPSTQPGLWCDWVVEDDNMIVWNESEKFYFYTEWLVYLIEKILKPNGYVLNGTVKYRGEDFDDAGEITVNNNKVFLNDVLEKPKKSMRCDVVLILDNLEDLILPQ